MQITWGLVLEIVIVLAVLMLIWKFVSGIFRMALIVVVVLAGIWVFQYVTADDFSADKLFSDLGNAVESVADMTPSVLNAAEDTINYIQEIGSQVSFNEKGLRFTNGNAEGTLGLNGKGIVLHMTAPISDQSAINTIVQIASLFSGDSSIAQTADTLVNGGGDRKVDWGNGYAEVNNGIFILVREK